MYSRAITKKPKKSPKVLFVFDRVAHYHKDLFRSLDVALSDEGVELHLLSGQEKEDAIGRAGLHQKVIRNEYKYRFKEYRIGEYTVRNHSGVLEAIQKIRPDILIILGHVGNMSHWRIIQLKRKLGFKLVAWQCGYEFNPGRIKDILLRRFIPAFDHHLAYHTNAAKYALNYGASNEKVTVIHNTINEARIDTMPKSLARDYVRARYPTVGTRKIVLFVGAILEDKRIEVLLQAMQKRAANDAVLIIVGDGAHMANIRALCSNRSGVILTGAIIDGVGPYFDAADVYVLPGTGGLGINEAMAHGLPIISGYADGSADDLVIDGKNGLRLHDDSVEELREKIDIILDNPDLAARFGRQSQEWITGKYAFSLFVRRVTETIKKLVSS
jgi:glycosyltransferase involved in cell wall biosynthesis